VYHLALLNTKMGITLSGLQFELKQQRQSQFEVSPASFMSQRLRV
jgi:hypothetical protein